jgi:xylulokinase
MGERTPHLDGTARAALVGLTASHTRGHIVRAILEGVAFSLRDSFTIFEEMKVPVKSIRLGGGGARSNLLQQIQADVYGHEVEIVEAEEGAAYGAAILAGLGGGLWPTLDAACNSVIRVTQRVPVRKDVMAKMNSAYSQFRQIYPATRSILKS